MQMETSIINCDNNYKVFRRSFLKKICVKIEFPEINFLLKKSDINQFLSSIFGIQNEFKPTESLDSISIKADDESFAFTFQPSKASVEIDSNFYKSYENTLKPCIQILISYLDALGIDKIEDISIDKVNLWTARIENAGINWRPALYATFKDSNIRNITKTNWETKEGIYPLKISRQAIQLNDDKEIKINFSVIIPDDSHFKFKLIIGGTHKDINKRDIFNITDKLNLKIFHTFISMISDHIINMMQKD